LLAARDMARQGDFERLRLLEAEPTCPRRRTEELYGFWPRAVMAAKAAWITGIFEERR
jgi:hypothetical protein